MKPLISIKNLSKCYQISQKNKKKTTFREMLTECLKGWFTKEEKEEKKEFWALKDLSFTVEEGEKVAILGRNGAGKSTLLKVLSRITHPTEGRIEIRGRVASLLEVGTGFHPELTGEENIYLNGAIMGMTRREIKKQFDSIVDFAEVESFLNVPVKRYSSGMYVKLAFAVAAHLESEILIMDEVLAVGDSHFHKKCLGKINEISKKGRTIFFVSHNMATVRSICNQGILLDKGSLVMQGPLEKCIQSYLEDPLAMTGSLWEGRSGNDSFYVSRLQIRSKEEDAALFDRAASGTIEIEMTAEKDLNDLIFMLNFYSIHGQMLMQRKVAPNLAEHFVFDLKKGTYQVSLDIDFSLFTEGTYFLEIDAGIHNIVRIVDHLRISFSVVDSKQKIGGTTQLLSPNWSWKFEESFSS